MNYAIWSAVSTKAQATEDKISIESQEKKSRALALSKGWVETAGPFRVPGASRSFYVNLSDAEKDIPQLAAMLDAAKSRRFDLLIFYSYDRLGDLADMIAVTLRFYGVQLLSVSQGTEVQSPDTFDPYQSDAESNMRTMHRMVQQYRIAEMRRKYRDGMEKRVNDGLNPNRIPYGYTKPSGQRRAIAVPVPAQSTIIIEIKDLFLHGHSYYQIMHTLNAKGYPTPEGAASWSHSTIKKILLHPFYAGKVSFARRRVSRDVRDKSIRLVINPNPLMRDGKHTPLYSWETYQAILAEAERRERLPRNNRFQFSGLLTCSLCGEVLHHNRGTWRCPYHIVMTDAEALALIPKKIQQSLSITAPHTPASPAPKADSASKILDHNRQRRRIQQAYEAEVYSLEEAQKKMADIDAKIKALKNTEVTDLRKQASHQTYLTTLAGARSMLTILPQWIASDDPRQVNLFLLRLIRTITLTPDLTITVHLRD